PRGRKKNRQGAKTPRGEKDWLCPSSPWRLGVLAVKSGERMRREASALRLPVPRPQDQLHLLLRVEALDVRRVVAAQAEVGLRRRDDEALFVRVLRVQRAGPVARLALHVLELLVVRDRAAAGLVVAGDVAAHAVEVELLEVLLERRVRGVMRGLVPDLARVVVAVGAGVDADVRGLARLDRRGDAVGEG